MDFQYLKEKESTKRFHLKKKAIRLQVVVFFISLETSGMQTRGTRAPGGRVVCLGNYWRQYELKGRKRVGEPTSKKQRWWLCCVIETSEIKYN